MVSGRPQVIQGLFLGNRLQIAARHHQTGIVQPSVRGPATQLPPAVLNLHPRGAGQRLPGVVQRKMEALFNASFSDVRVHVGTEASAIGAVAFTHGSDLYFAHGQYNPNSPHGLRLIGHELTHVLQQKTGRVRSPFGSGIAVVQDPGLEAEAERMGLKAVMPQPQVPPLRQGVVTQPCRSPLPSNPQRLEAPSPQVVQTALLKFLKTTNQILKFNSYGYIPGHGLLEPPPRTSEKLPLNEGGYYNKEMKKIVVNELHTKRSQDSTYEHEKAHFAHNVSPGIDIYNNPEDLLITELVAKHRGAIETLKQYEGGKKATTPDEIAKLKEAVKYRDHPEQFNQEVIDTYAKEYQNQFSQDNLTRIGAEILKDLHRKW